VQQQQLPGISIAWFRSEFVNADMDSHHEWRDWLCRQGRFELAYGNYQKKKGQTEVWPFL
jgi:hypothetical protein